MMTTDDNIAGDESRIRMCVSLITVHVVCGILMAIGTGERPPREIHFLSGVFLGLFLAQVSLLALWLNDGILPLRIRIITTIAGTAYLATIPMLIYVRIPPDNFYYGMIALWLCVFIGVHISIVSSILALFRYMWFTIGLTNNSSYGAPITLQVMAVLIVLCGLSFSALAVVANSQPWTVVELMWFSAYLMITSALIAVIALWAGLANKGMIVKVIYGAMFSGSIGAVAIFALVLEEALLLMIVLFVAYAVQLGTLVYIRPLGYRIGPPSHGCSLP
jgi:hypothetical protein